MHAETHSHTHVLYIHVYFGRASLCGRGHRTRCYSLHALMQTTGLRLLKQAEEAGSSHDTANDALGAN